MKDLNIEIIGSGVADVKWEHKKSQQFIWEGKNNVLVPTGVRLVDLNNEKELSEFLAAQPERTVAGLHFEPKDAPEGNYFVYRKQMQVVIKTTTRSDGHFILRVNQRDNTSSIKNAKVLPNPNLETPKQDIQKSVITPLGVKNDMGSVQIENISIPKDS